MTEMRLLAGYGSSKYQADRAAREMSAYRGVPALGITLLDASKNLEATAESIDGQDLYTHSGGALGFKMVKDEFPDCIPRSVVFVASPIPTASGVLIRHSPSIVQHLAVDSLRSPRAFISNTRHLHHTLKDGLRYYKDNWNMIRPISEFDTITYAGRLEEEGIAVELVYQESDELFPITNEIIDRVALAGLKASAVRGGHAELACYTSRFMQRYNERVSLESFSFKTSRNLGKVSLRPLVS